MIRPLIPTLALAVAMSAFSPALADDARDRSAAVSTEPAAPPKIRVILPASWEPAIPQAASQTASPQRNAAR